MIIALAITQAISSGAHLARALWLDDPPARQLIASQGASWYGIAAVSIAVGESLGVYIATGLPVVGLCAVALSGTGLDRWQLTTGVVQAVGVVLGVCVLATRWGWV